MEIKRDLYLKKLIDSKHNGMIKVVDVRDLSPGRDVPWQGDGVIYLLTYCGQK